MHGLTEDGNEPFLLVYNPRLEASMNLESPRKIGKKENSWKYPNIYIFTIYYLFYFYYIYLKLIFIFCLIFW